MTGPTFWRVGRAGLPLVSLGSARRMITRAVLAICLIALICSVASEAMILQAVAPPAPVTQIYVGAAHRDSTSARLEVITKFGPTDRNLIVTAFATRGEVLRKRLAVFADPEYPYAGSSPALVATVGAELSAEMAVQAPEVESEAVDASGLVRVVNDIQDAADTVVLVLTGTIPMSVFSSSLDLLSPWVRAGGLIVWAGDAIGYYSASKAGALDPTSSANPRAAGSAALLGDRVVSFPTVHGRVGSTKSAIAGALSLTYREASSGLSTSLLDHGLGVDLGYRVENVTSIAFWPRGRGGYLIFGGPIVDALAMGKDISRILISNILSTTATPVSRQVIGRDPHMTVDQIEVPITKFSDSIMLVVTADDTYPFFLAVRRVPI